MLLEPEDLSSQTVVAQILNLNELIKITNYILHSIYVIQTLDEEFLVHKKPCLRIT